MTLRDAAALAALAIGIVGAVAAWLDQPGSVKVPPGRSDPGAFLVNRVDTAKSITTADDSTVIPVATSSDSSRTSLSRTGSPGCGPRRMTSASASGR
jgi:hypothetical protein